MLAWDELKKAELGQTFDGKELKECCPGVYGGISWPGKRPGFAVVVGMHSFKTFGRQRHEVCLLDEVESADMWELIERCSGLDLKYSPSVWIGDSENPIADEFMREMRSDSNWCAFSVTRASIVVMDRPYQYMLQSLRRMLRKDSRTLFLKDSRVIEYLRDVDPDAELELELGEYPAIEALAFAVLEMKKRGRGNHVTLEQIHAWQKKYSLR